MRSKWEDGDLYLHTAERGWVQVGWVEPTRPNALVDPGFVVFCHWMIGLGDYPEGHIFETEKQARRALKAAATVALVGGLIKAKNF